MQIRTTPRLLAAVAVLALTGGVAAACAASDNGSKTDSAGVAAPAQGDAAAQNNAGANGANKEAAAPPVDAPKVPEQVEPESRSIVYTGMITIRVSNVDDIAQRVTALATGGGGFVAGDERHSSNGQSDAKITLRVAPDRFQSTVDAIGKLGKDGKDEGRSVSAQDVTEQVADIDARITIGQASVDRVRALLAKAQTIGEITSLESELSRREADLESLKARKKKLDGLTSLSTITAMILGPGSEVAKPPADDSGFLAGLKAGWHTFVASLNVAMTVLGAVLPFVLVLGIPAWLILRYTRRFRTSRPKRPALAYPPITPWDRSAVPPADQPGAPAATAPSAAPQPDPAAPTDPAPAAATPAPEEPTREEPKPEAQKQEGPKQEEPKQETPEA